MRTKSKASEDVEKDLRVEVDWSLLPLWLAPGFGRTLLFLAGGAELPASGLDDPARFRVWDSTPEATASESLT